jgi:hypothetical protein
MNGTGGPTDYMLDNFVAHKLSLLTECGARALPFTVNPNWLGKFILTNAFTFPLAPKPRAYVFNFLRRADGALSAYHEARIALIAYLETPRNVYEVCGQVEQRLSNPWLIGRLQRPSQASALLLV